MTVILPSSSLISEIGVVMKIISSSGTLSSGEASDETAVDKTVVVSLSSSLVGSDWPNNESIKGESSMPVSVLFTKLSRDSSTLLEGLLPPLTNWRKSSTGSSVEEGRVLDTVDVINCV